MRLSRTVLGSVLVLSLHPSALLRAEPIHFPACGLDVDVPAYWPADGDTVKLTVHGEKDECAQVSATAGDLSLVRQDGGFGVVVGTRSVAPPPGVNCPAVMVPFTLDVRLPLSLPPTGAGLVPVTFYSSLDAAIPNQPPTLTECGTLELPAPAPGPSIEATLFSRFEVRVWWWTNNFDGSHRAQVVADSQSSKSGNAATFWFFSPDNPEVMVKMLDGCAINGHMWAFAAATTDVGYRIQVHDLEHNDVWAVENEPGTLSGASFDATRFPCPLHEGG